MFIIKKINYRILFLLVGYFLINLYLIFNLNYYDDDWVFFARNHLDYFAHSYENSFKIQEGVNREASIIFFIFLMFLKILKLPT